MDDLIITDTSPLITLAIADHLHALTSARLRVVVPDAVHFEATRFEGAPGATRIIDWMALHDDLVTIRGTQVGLDQMERVRQGRPIRGMGEQAAQEVLETTAKLHPERHMFLIFEDRDVEKRSLLLPERAYAISTGDWLRVLEKKGLIQSTDEILDRAAAEGRTVDRQRRSMSSDEAVDAARSRVDAANRRAGTGR